ncbi:hypothetical protein ACFU44_13825 [Nocardia rhizosphaerihabitans]|uniref:hypothetical protein n=1 Tax=Nocardia rhizosphaerihabitans TaxID=1691570 RepID=UPI00366E56BA
MLYEMAQEGWGTRTAGDLASPSGRFTRITNDPREIPSIVQAFDDSIAQAGLADPDQLVGHFMVEEEWRHLTVTKYANEQDLLMRYGILEQWHLNWQREMTRFD